MFSTVSKMLTVSAASLGATRSAQNVRPSAQVQSNTCRFGVLRESAWSNHKIRLADFLTHRVLNKGERHVLSIPLYLDIGSAIMPKDFVQHFFDGQVIILVR